MADYLLTIAHHAAVFSLVGVLAAEIALLRPGLTALAVKRLGRLDAAYGALAALVIAAGFGRIFFGLKGPEFYLPNPYFWLKIGAFLIVGLISAVPTLAILRWRRRLRVEAGWSPPDAEVAGLRRYFAAELAVLATIPLWAAALARGWGS